MASSTRGEEIEQQAATWAARALDGTMPADISRAFDAWMEADRLHRGAYLRARAALYALEDAMTGEADRRATPPRAAANDGETADAATFGRHRAFGRFAIGGALAASLLAMVGFGVTQLLSTTAQQDASASRQLALTDGSVATLGEGARIEFAMRDGIRKVVLLKGEASFKVAKDRAHPFVVQSGDVYAQATGTVYSVRRVGDGGGAVRVTEGSVLVWGRDDREQAVLLHAGGALTLEPGQRRADPPSAARTVKPAPPPPEVAQFALDNVTIASAAERFNRVNRTRIVVTDPVVGQVRIVGLFRANDPEHFARAAAAVAGAETATGNGRIVIKSK